jgi:hypothetical protein
VSGGPGCRLGALPAEQALLWVEGDPTKTGHPDRVHQPSSKVGSAVCPSVARVTSGRPRPPPTTWILVGRPPRMRPNPCWAARPQASAPLAGASNMLVARTTLVSTCTRQSNSGGVDLVLHRPLDSGLVPSTSQRANRFAAGLPRPIAPGQTPPRRPVRQIMPLIACR